MKRRWIKIASVLSIVGAISLYTYHYYQSQRTGNNSTDIATFEECAAAGYPVMESYPEQCRTPDGRIFTKVYPETVPTDISLSGTYTCLPKKDTGGPVTLECAFGLATQAGYFALDMSAVMSQDYPALYGNEKIEITGTLLPLEMISSDRYQIYKDLIGIIVVKKATIL